MSSVTPAVRKRVHLDFIDGLRAVAALYVLLHHARVITFIDGAYPGKGVLSLATYPLKFGSFAVVLFIVLSGYCLILPVIARGSLPLRAFFVRRAQRILPPYYLALVLTGLITLMANRLSPGIQDSITWHGLLARSFLIHDLFRTTLWEWNVPLWSVAVEWRIYLIFPLMVAAIKRFGAKKTIRVTWLLSLFLVFGLEQLAGIWPGLTSPLSDPVGVMPHFLGLFGFGVMAGIWSRKSWGQPRRVFKTYAILGISLGLLTALDIPRLAQVLPRCVGDYLFGAGVGCLLTYLSKNPQSRLRALLEWRPLVALGGISYSFYLLHDSLLHLLSRGALLHLELDPIVYFAALSLGGLLLTLGVASLFYRLVERPLMTWAAKTRS